MPLLTEMGKVQCSARLAAQAGTAPSTPGCSDHLIWPGSQQKNSLEPANLRAPHFSHTPPYSLSMPQAQALRLGMAAARLLLKHRPSPQNIGPRMVGCPTSQDAVLGLCVDRSDQVPADPLLWLTWSSRQNVSLCVLTRLAGMRWAWAFRCFVRAQPVADTQHNGASPAAVLALHLCTCDTELLQLVHFGTPREIELTLTSNEQGLKGP